MRLPRMLALGLSMTAALSAAAHAQTTVVFWDFFGGGDGIRMKQIVDDFNKSQKDIVVNRTTQTWGNPFYTKVHTAVVSGQTPDLMTYHLSAVPSGLQKNDLRAITPAELAMAGLKISDFQPNLVKTLETDAKAAGKTGHLRRSARYPHLRRLLQQRPAEESRACSTPTACLPAMNSIADMTKAMQTIKDKTGVTPMALSTNQDSATPWRLWYSLFLQQGGTMFKDGKLYLGDLDTKGKAALQTMADWTKDGLLTKNTAYPAGVALFTAGRTAMMFNGNWEVPTMVDAKAKGSIKFDYGIMSFPASSAATTRPGRIRTCWPSRTTPSRRSAPTSSRRS